MDAKLIDRWRRIPTAIAADVSRGKLLIDPAIRPLKPPGQQPKLFGFAVTAVCEPPDFGAVLRALDLVKRGDVLVIAAQANVKHAMIGGILGGHLHRKGAAGLICDGAVRDVAELAALEGFSVYARAVTPKGPERVDGDIVNTAALVGGRTVGAGDLLIGDDDGVVALSNQDAAEFIDAAEKKLSLEGEWIASLKADKTAAETFNLKNGETP